MPVHNSGFLIKEGGLQNWGKMLKRTRKDGLLTNNIVNWRQNRLVSKHVRKIS